MANSHGIVTQAITTSTPAVTQNFTQTSLGTPLGYLLWATEGETINSNFNHQQLSQGASDLSAVDGFMTSTNYEDTVATSDASTEILNAAILQIHTPGTNDATEAADHNATVTDGIQVNFTATGTAKLATAILLKEGIANVDVQAPALNTTGATTITTGFMPDIVIAYTPARDTVNTAANEHHTGMTFYHRADDVYAGYTAAANHGDTTPDSAERYDESEVPGRLGITSGAYTNAFTLGNFTATGFDATKVSETSTMYIVWIAIKLSAGYSSEVGTATAPVSTGVDSLITGLDHTPQIAFFLGTLETAAGGSITECAFFQGACTADDEVCVGGAIEDSGGATQNTEANNYHRDDSCIYISDDAHTTVISKAAFDSFQTDGVDVNFSTADSAIKIGYLTIGPTISSNVGHQLKQRLFAT